MTLERLPPHEQGIAMIAFKTAPQLAADVSRGCLDNWRSAVKGLLEGAGLALADLKLCNLQNQRFSLHQAFDGLSVQP